ncbi:MAG TPA: AIPR family protein [Blastocatellia bacterium]|nr:AIPR family protein [Blastocatellia bacterium]
MSFAGLAFAKGMTILAEEVIKSNDEETLKVRFASDEQGIVDGAHTYEIIMRGQSDIAELNAAGEAVSINQYVKIEVLTGLDSSLVTEIAGGLNTAVQVQQMSLAELGNEFDWIKEELKKANFLQHVAFKENEVKVNRFDARDVIRLLYLFNITEFPNDGAAYPIRAYTSKEGVLKDYREKVGDTEYAGNYKRLRPILNEILILHDTISARGREMYNKGGGKRGGRLKFVETLKSRYSLYESVSEFLCTQTF